MSARGFHSISMVAGVAAAALGCYMVSLRVASERAALEEVENRIVLAQRDIRVLQTEIGTRGRLAQLESWNVKVLALSAPAANQFVEGGFALASMVAPDKTVDPTAPVILASAPSTEAKPQLATGTAAPQKGVAARDLLQVASLKRDVVPVRGQPQPQPIVATQPRPVSAKLAAKPQTSKPVAAKPVAIKLAAAPAPAKAAAKTAATKPAADAKKAAEAKKKVVEKGPAAKPAGAAKPAASAKAKPEPTGGKLVKSASAAKSKPVPSTKPKASTAARTAASATPIKTAKSTAKEAKAKQ